ncbi:MAG: RHS repeat protein [Caldilineaceae bacterium]|nr:RHS repeat protein [Caldilineaceae bacterium]
MTRLPFSQRLVYVVVLLSLLMGLLPAASPALAAREAATTLADSAPGMERAPTTNLPAARNALAEKQSAPSLQPSRPLPVYAMGEVQSPRERALATLPTTGATVAGDSQSRLAAQLAHIAQLTGLSQRPVYSEENASAAILPASDSPSSLSVTSIHLKAKTAESDLSAAPFTDVKAQMAILPAEALAQSGGWGVGNTIGLNCGTEIRTGPGLAVHTIVPEDNWAVVITEAPRYEYGETWWNTSRFLAGDPSGGTGWVSQQQSEAATCPGDGDDGGGRPPLNWGVGELIGLCKGTEIRHGPNLVIHTIVPEDEWLVKITEAPRYQFGQTWWNTSRREAGDPSGGTGWVSQEQTEAACDGNGNLASLLGQTALSPAQRAFLRAIGFQEYLRYVADPVSASTGIFTHRETDVDVPGVAGFNLVLERIYNSGDARTGLFGAGWTSLLDMSLRIANDGSIDVRYPDGSGAYFVLDGDEYVAGQDGNFDVLTYEEGSGFELATVTQLRYRFDDRGRLLSVQERHGNTITLERDGDGRVGRIVDSGGRVFTLSYSGDFVGSIVDAEGRTLTYGYAGERLVSFTDANNGTHQYGYTGEWLSTLTDPEGITYLRNIYDGNGRVVEQFDAAGSRSTVAYDDANQRTTFTDNLGNQKVYEFDDLKRVTRIVDALGNAERFVYDDDDNVTEYTNKLDNTWRYTYDAHGNQLSVTDPFNQTASTAYNATNDITGMTDVLNRTTTYIRNSAGDVERIIFPDTSEVTATYDSRGQMLSQTDANQHTTQYDYDGAGNLIRMTDAGNHATQYTYDSVGRLTRITDPRGGSTQFVYDGNDNIRRIIDADNQITEFVYDGNDSLVQVTDREGGITRYEYDVNLRLIKEIDAESHVTEHSYDLMYNRIGTLDARQNATRYGYDELYRLVEIEDALGGSVRMEYDALGQQIRMINQNDVVTRMDYDALGRLIREVVNEQPALPADAQTNVTTEYSYDGFGNLRSVEDANGNITTYEYDLLDRLVSEENAEGEITQHVYDAGGNLVQLINPRGHSTHFSYNADNLLIGVTNALTQETQIAYDANHNPVSVRDPHGVVTQQEYDALNQLRTVIRNYRPAQAADSQTNVTTRYTHYPEGRVATMTDPKGNLTEYRYDRLFRLTAQKDAQNGITAYTYDVVGNLITVTDANLNSRSYTYDELNRLIRQTDGEGHEERFTYDPAGNLLTHINGREYASTFSYDPLNRLTQTLDARNGTISLVYDAVGNVLSVTNQNNRTQTFDYDQVYRVLRHVDAANYETRYGYDANGNPVSVTDGNNNVTSFAYDKLDRLESMTNAEGETTHYQYDALGNPTAQIEADGIVTRFEYDPLYRLSAVVLNHNAAASPDAATNVRYAYGYDANGNFVKMTDPLNQTTHFVYDSLDRLVRETNPLGKIWEYTYDPAGNLRSRLDANNNLTEYTYTADNLLARVSYPDGSFIVHEYDANHNRVKMTDSLGVATWSYDELDRLISTRDSLGRTLGYGYDAVGNRTSLTYADGRTVAYSYTPNDWLATVTDPAGGVTRYDRDGVGQTTRITNPNDTVAELTYDRADRLLSQVTRQTVGAKKTISAFHYTLDDVGQRTQTRAEYGWRKPAQVITNYSYDGLRRLIRTADNEGVWAEYQFDAASNRRQLRTNDDSFSPKPFDAQKSLYTYNAANQLLEVREESTVGKKTDIQTTFFTYDANGNRINEAFSGPQGPKSQGTDYTYDYENRLIAALDYQNARTRNLDLEFDPATAHQLFLPVLVDGNNASAQSLNQRVERALTQMSYDGLGRRLIKRYDPKTGASGIKRTDYVFDGLDPIAEYDLWNGHIRNFYRGDLNRMIAMQTFPSSGRYWFAHDGLGSVTGVTKQQGQSVHNYRYDVYGEVIPVSGNWTDPHNHYTYTGQEWDNETGLLHFYARDYDPRAGVWMQQDPYRGQSVDPLTLHRYGYVAGNPVNYVDAYGYFIDYLVDGAFLLYDIHEFQKDPSLENAGLLALDIALAVLPFVPAGAGATIRGVKAAERLEDVHTIYQSKDWLGRVEYVGIAKDFQQRSYQHLTQSQRRITPIAQVPSRDARAVEEALIQRHGLSNLSNKIHSINPNRADYANQLSRGQDILQDMRYWDFHSSAFGSQSAWRWTYRSAKGASIMYPGQNREDINGITAPYCAATSITNTCTVSCISR